MLDIAQILLDQQKITKEQFDQVKIISVSKGLPEDYIISQNKLVSEVDLVQAKGVLFNVPFIDIMPLDIPRTALNSLTEETAKTHQAIVFGEDEKGRLKVAMANPLDVLSIRYIQQKTGKELAVFIAVPKDIIGKIDLLYGQQIETQVESDVKAASNEVEVIDEQLSDMANFESTVKSAPVARIVNTVLEYAVKSKASDIHVEPMKDRLRFRYRIYGILGEKLAIDSALAPAVVSRIKILSSMKIDEKRVPQDGRFEIKVGGEDVDLRVSTLPVVFGEKVVIRLLRKTGGIAKLDSSGMRGMAYKIYLDALKVTSGILLITGPTGSGKTQTLASSLDLINQPTVNISTLEDPIELRIEGVNQVQINPAAGLTFASGLRAFLRQDPNIIMVGEIRDEETARLATQAALTGHLVLSTIHTNSAAGALPRLLDMNIEPYLIASTVTLTVGQRLVRVVCPECISYSPAPNELVIEAQRVLAGVNDFNITEYIRRRNEAIKTKVNVQEGVLYLAKGKGCAKCSNSGYQGRIGIYEVLKVTEKMGQMIMQHRTANEIESEAKQNGMLTMLQDGYLKALDGITTIEEVLRVAKD